jgi:hypothetical protein
MPGSRVRAFARPEDRLLCRASTGTPAEAEPTSFSAAYQRADAIFETAARSLAAV